MPITNGLRALALTLALSALAPMLAACNTVAGAGKDTSAAGKAISDKAVQVKQGL